MEYIKLFEQKGSNHFIGDYRSDNVNIIIDRLHQFGFYGHDGSLLMDSLTMKELKMIARAALEEERKTKKNLLNWNYGDLAITIMCKECRNIPEDKKKRIMMGFVKPYVTKKCNIVH